MSTTYKVIFGDTFERIARKRLGSEREGQRIQRANPGVIEPLTPGLIITIPQAIQSSNATSTVQPPTASSQLSLLIKGVAFTVWERLSITQTMDAMSSLQFSAPMEVDNAAFKLAFRPMSFAPIAVTLGTFPLFAGTMININPLVNPAKKAVEIGAYSLPGVLNDCCAPASSQLWEYNDYNLTQIAASVLAPFGLAAVFQSDPGAPFERVSLRPDEKVLPWLIRLASQRGMLISSTGLGQLLFYTPLDTIIPVATLAQGSSPLLSVSPNFDPQSYYSHITGFEAPKVKNKNQSDAGSQYSAPNPHLPIPLRPYNYTVGDTESSDMQLAVDTKLARMYANAVSYNVQVSTWRSRTGGLWAAGDIVTLHAPDSMIYRPYRLRIRAVTLERAENHESATLQLVLPGSFAGTLPESMPWDG